MVVCLNTTGKVHVKNLDIPVFQDLNISIKVQSAECEEKLDGLAPLHSAETTK